MKKNFKMTVAAMVVAMVGVGAYMTQNQQKGTMSDIALANVDALAEEEMYVEDLVANCVWQENSYCYYIVVYPSGNTVWSHWNMRNI